MIEILDMISKQHNNLESMGDYRSLVIRIAPLVATKLGCWDVTKHSFPLPSDETIIPYAHLMFGALSPLRLGIIDGQHRMCALLALFSGLTLVHQQRASHPVAWSSSFRFRGIHPSLSGNVENLRKLLSNAGSMDYHLLIPIKDSFHGQFGVVQEAAFSRSQKTDESQRSSLPLTLCASVYKPILQEFLDSECSSGTFATYCVGHHEYNYSIRVLHDGKMVAHTLVLRKNMRYHDKKVSWLKTGGYWETLKNLGQYDVLCIAQDIATFTGTNGKVRVDQNDLYLKWNQETVTPDLLKEFRISNSSDKKIVDDIDSISRVLPPYTFGLGFFFLNEAIWSTQANISRVNVSGSNNPGVSISVPALIALHDSMRFLKLLLANDKMHNPLISWVTADLETRAHRPSSPWTQLKQWFVSRETTKEQKILYLGKLIFFPIIEVPTAVGERSSTPTTSTRRSFGRYNLEKFSALTPLPMLLPKSILSFARFLGFLSHHKPWLAKLRDLAWWNLEGKQWDKLLSETSRDITSIHEIDNLVRQLVLAICPLFHTARLCLTNVYHRSKIMKTELR